MKEYLEPARYINSDHPEIIRFVGEHKRASKTKKEQIVHFYYLIRDKWKYDPYQLDLTEEGMKASNLLSRDHGYCIEKAALLAACARVLDIPSRLGFANVKNHIGIEKYVDLLKTDELVFHGYTEVFLNDRWIKATPAFNKELCDRLGVQPLDFNGEDDSIFQEFNSNGLQFMEYLKDHGQFSDVPRERFISEIRKSYPHLLLESLREKGFHIKLD
jgi:transglutaminase-like putative cysteine protease